MRARTHTKKSSNPTKQTNRSTRPGRPVVRWAVFSRAELPGLVPPSRCYVSGQRCPRCLKVLASIQLDRHVMCAECWTVYPESPEAPIVKKARKLLGWRYEIGGQQITAHVGRSRILIKQTMF